MATGPQLRCVIAAGGTAGHVLPALAVADALRERGVFVTLAGSPDRVEARLVPEAGYELDTFRISGLPRRPGPELVRALVRAASAPRGCRGILRQRRPDVVFGGGVCSFGVTPLAFQTDPRAWADSLADLTALGSTVVPGHGPVGSVDELLTQAAYLLACAEADGDPRAVAEGPWDDWPERDNDEVNVERAALLAQGETAIPPSMLRRAGLA